MRLLRLLLLPSVQSLAISPITSNASLFNVLPSSSNISSYNANNTSNNTESLNEMEVMCRAIDRPFLTAIEVDYCGPAISIACRKLRFMAETHERQGAWNWVPLTPHLKCVAGFYVPLQARPWMFPSLDDCHSLIFEHILYVCGRNSNVGTMNVDKLPNSTTPGTAVLEGYPRYLMASKLL